MGAKGLTERPNLIFLMTDQQRSVRDFPPEWVQANLPSMERLQRNGITYSNMYINTSPCWASRASMISGTYPLIHQVISYGAELGSERASFSEVLKAAGYRVVYKGKWHLTSEFDEYAEKWIYDDDPSGKLADEDKQMTSYGMEGWTAPDMGTTLVQASTLDDEDTVKGELATLGAGIGKNDWRVVTGEGLLAPDQQGVLEFLADDRSPDTPYCLVVSLVNPHDVSVYPYCLEAAGYSLSEFEGLEGFELPISYSDDLLTKPWAQKNFLEGFDKGPLTEDEALNYLKFYAYLHTLSDALFMTILDAMSEEQLANTLIFRTSDHGEMAMAHGGMREKMNNFYQETVNVPLIVSNPLLFPKPVTCDELVSVVDLVPTIASLVGVKPESLDLEHPLQGKDFSQTFDDPTAKTQDAVLFTFFSGSSYRKNELPPDTPPGEANCICGIVTKEWKYAVYFKPENGLPVELLEVQAPGGGTIETYPTVQPRIMPVDDIHDPWRPVVEKGSVQYELYQLAEGEGTEMINLAPINVYKPTIPKQRELHKLLTTLLEQNQSLPEGWDLTTPP